MANSTDLFVDIETTGFNPLQDVIIGIGLCSGNKEDYTYVHIEEIKQEKTMLEEFWIYVERNKIDTIIGFNIGFDWSFLKLRSLKHQLDFTWFKNYHNRKDIRIILNSDRYAKGTLKDYAEFFGFRHDDSIDGKDVPTLFVQGEYEQIEQHCVSDLKITRAIYERLLRHAKFLEREEE